MSYQGPMLIKEPELRWPVILVAAIITTCIVLVAAGALHLTLTRPAASPAAQPRLEGALRPEMPEFERLREKIIVEQLIATEAPRPLNNDFSLEMKATVRNTTDRTLSGLELRGAPPVRHRPLGDGRPVLLPGAPGSRLRAVMR
ncbi:MAG: hypothetical protein M3416_01120 [Acidobacteriota bacterium]|nr:hypothetical protein [Acidobacteriota bacterium]